MADAVSTLSTREEHKTNLDEAFQLLAIVLANKAEEVEKTVENTT